MSPDPETHDEGRRELDVRVGFGLFASEDQLDSLLSIARRVDVEVGQVLYTRGDPLTTLFQVITGSVELRAPDVPTWHVGDRGAVGLVDFAIGRSHARTAVTTERSQLLELDAADYRDYLEDNYEVGHRILSQMSGRLVADMIASPDPAHFLARTADHERRWVAEVEIPLVERLIILSRMPAFLGTSMQALANLAQSATERRFAPGDVIATAGTDPGMVSLLVEGTVELELPNGRVQRGGRDFVTHLEELTIGPRLTTTTSTTDTIVLQLDRDDLIDRIEEHFDLAMTLLAFVATEQARVNDASSPGRCRVA
ncbi:MAG TPA: cyclic nucleotide-binding domain-containing protein [Kofleriaceae bacterium]|nr:cyclic nucleotide-binding domain-containing protein [Kofleriaceae bacterium]